jgi:membrane protein insertase Oxa1/YidC/SpoIIIJ
MMTTVMPLMFGFMFINVASGLVLYWLTGSLVGIAQQALINRWIPATQTAPAPRRPSSPAEH